VAAPREAARRGGTVAFDVPHAYEVSRCLLEREILVDYRPGAGIRVAPHFYTSDDELELAVAAIDEILASGAWQRHAGRSTVVT
jgi:kynureninase